MNPEKAEKIFKLMRQFGVEYFKHEDFEVRLSPQVAPRVEVAPKPTLKPQQKKGSKKAPPPQAVPVTEENIPHHENEVANLLKLDDYSLVDKLFPDFTQMNQRSGE